MTSYCNPQSQVSLILTACTCHGSNLIQKAVIMDQCFNCRYNAMIVCFFFFFFKPRFGYGNVCLCFTRTSSSDLPLGLCLHRCISKKVLNHVPSCSCDVPCGSYHSRQKLTFNLKPFALNSVLPEGRGGFSKAKVVAVTLNAFMASADQTITTRHVPSYRMNKKGDRVEIDQHEKPVLTQSRK